MRNLDYTQNPLCASKRVIACFRQRISSAERSTVGNEAGMKFRHIPLVLVAAIFWIPQELPLRAQSCADAIRIPYRAPTCGQSAERAVRISYSEAFANAISMPQLIHSTRSENGRVGVIVVVTPTGTVASANASSRNEQWQEKAAALAMTWHFVPFQREGSAVYTLFHSVIHVVPPERRPEGHISFPEIKDWNSLRITLERTRCLGACPAYKLTIFGDGRVQYHGDNDWVDYSAKEYRGHVSAEAVRQLVNLFRIADYFNLFDQYVSRTTDAPAFTTSISFDGESKSVVDYVGVNVGMPEFVRTVEDGIDLLAGPKVWHERQKRALNNVGN